ncbi:MAG: PD40 domain-containing protein [Spirochaetales bacterium]|nr:PD40 domain-containing protein [Spirochaetales bacterium]
MKRRICCIILFTGILLLSLSATDIKNNKIEEYTEFQNEREVIIEGYNLDAMEPFISPDGKYLFFNSLNDSIDTCLHYAERSDDVHFHHKGKISGVNGEPPHLDAVASMDEDNNFYFISTRDYPEVFENLQSGQFKNGAVKNVAPVKGNIYVRAPGLIVMDAGINNNGYELYYAVAQYSGKAMPDKSKIGVARKEGASFIREELSDMILENVNNPEYLVYAPCISASGNELFFTRIKIGTQITEVVRVSRSEWGQSFGNPQVLKIPGESVEAPTLSKDGKRIYYHKKLSRDGKYHIFMMVRK